MTKEISSADDIIAVILKAIDEVTAQIYIEGTSKHYVEYKKWYNV